MVCERRKALLHALLGVDVASDYPEYEEEDYGCEDDVSDSVTGLGMYQHMH